MEGLFIAKGVGECGGVCPDTLSTVRLWYTDKMVRVVDEAIGGGRGRFEGEDGVIFEAEVSNLASG